MSGNHVRIAVGVGIEVVEEAILHLVVALGDWEARSRIRRDAICR